MKPALRKVIGTSLVFGIAACGGQILLGDASTSHGDASTSYGDDGGAHDAGLPTNSSDRDGANSGAGPIELRAVSVDAGITVGSCSFPFDAVNTWLLFDSDAVDYNRDLYAVRADGSAILRLTTDLYTEQNPTVSPNGRSLAFVSDRTGSKQIYVEDLATGSLAQLTTIVVGADQPSWSSDSSQITFHSGASVWIMAADGSGQRIVATGYDNFNVAEYPCLSLDGTEVVFGRNGEIDAVHLDGRGMRSVVLGETPAVSPDGTLVAYGGYCGGSGQIAITPFAGGASDPCANPRITPPSGYPRRPAWGPSGVVAFELTQGVGMAPASIAATAPDAGASCVLAGGPGDNRNPSWAPPGYQPR